VAIRRPRVSFCILVFEHDKDGCLWQDTDANRLEVRQAILGALRRIDANQGSLRDAIRGALRDRGEP